jgi:hypothetical protein
MEGKRLTIDLKVARESMVDVKIVDDGGPGVERLESKEIGRHVEGNARDWDISSVRSSSDYGRSRRQSGSSQSESLLSLTIRVTVELKDDVGSVGNRVEEAAKVRVVEGLEDGVRFEVDNEESLDPFRVS